MREPKRGDGQARYIYALLEPETRVIRYIGATVKNPRWRLSGHLNEAKHFRNRTHKVHWLRQLIDEGLRPEVMILEIAEFGTWQERECWWIGYFRILGVPLTNASSGGEGSSGWKHKPETLERIRRSSTGRRYPSRRPKPPEALAKMSQALKGRPKSPEHRMKLAAHLRERNAKGLSTTTRARISASRKEFFARRRGDVNGE